MEKIYDYIVIGSGFGGSVSAMRLGEKGYSVLVLEKGKHYGAKDFPKTNWNIKKYLWMPLLKCFGFQKLTFFKKVFVLSGVGVGGGSLVYANTHMVPPKEFFTNAAWSHFKNWELVLEPYYDLAKFMLGSQAHLGEDTEDKLLKEVAEDMGKLDSYKNVNVGVYFGDTQTPVDPYFKGLGPKRTGCTKCAGCMVGCRHGAKNTLDKNYLYFAQNYYGVKIEAETLVTKIEYKNGLYHIHTCQSTSWFKKNQRIFQSKGLVMSGGVLGTMDLLLRQKYQENTLHHLSDRLGENLRTNSEMLCGVTLTDKKLNHGVAISSIFNPDEKTHIEIVKFPDGSDAMGKLGTLATANGSPFVRIAKYIGNIVTHPWQFVRITLNMNFAKNSIILLVMQSLDNSMKMVWKKSLFGGKMTIDNSANGGGAVPSYIDIGQEVMKRYAQKANGLSANAITEILFNMATTAHILGGCPMGRTKEEGVVDENFAVHGYPNMFILDGSIIPCNLGVNPSLSITALSEYAMAQIPEKQGNDKKSLSMLLQTAEV